LNRHVYIHHSFKLKWHPAAQPLPWPGQHDRKGIEMGFTSIWHWIIVLAVVLILFARPGKISGIMGDFGKGLRSFKDGVKSDESEAEEEAEGEVVEKPAAKKVAKKAAKKVAKKVAPKKKTTKTAAKKTKAPKKAAKKKA
jgi:sec-independent protein translocase protein TatA